MKRGPVANIQPPTAKRPKRVENDYFGDLPCELSQRIVSFLPAYQRFGLERLSLVAKKWKDFLPKNTSFKDILSSCKENPEAVPYLLAHDSSLTYFTFDQVVALCGCHPILAQEVVGMYASLATLTYEHLMLLGRYDAAAANSILDLPFIHQQETYDFLNVIAFDFLEHHPDVVLRILTTPELADNLTELSRSKLGSRHERAAMLILATPTLLEGMDSVDIATLGQRHINVAIHILETPALLGLLQGFDLSILGEYIPAIARRILDAHADKLNGSDLAYMARRHIEIIEYILNTDALLDKLSGNDLALLGQCHQKIALRILNTFPEKLCGNQIVELGKNFPSVAMAILNSYKLSQQLLYCDNLSELGQSSAQVAFRILQSTQLRCKLFKEGGLILLAKNHVEVALYVLEQPEFDSLLDSAALVVLAKKSADIALYILTHLHLCNRLANNALAAIAKAQPAAALHILKISELSNLLDGNNLLLIDKHCPGVTLLIQSSTLLSKDVRAYLQNKQSDLLMIQSIAKKLYQNKIEEDAVAVLMRLK